MTNLEFQRLELSLQHLLQMTKMYQKQYRKVTGNNFILGQGIKKIRFCGNCRWVYPGISMVCCCEESPYFNQVVSEGCSEWYEIDGGSVY